MAFFFFLNWEEAPYYMYMRAFFSRGVHFFWERDRVRNWGSLLLPLCVPVSH